MRGTFPFSLPVWVGLTSLLNVQRSTCLSVLQYCLKVSNHPSGGLLHILKSLSLSLPPTNILQNNFSFLSFPSSSSFSILSLALYLYSGMQMKNSFSPWHWFWRYTEVLSASPADVLLQARRELSRTTFPTNAQPMFWGILIYVVCLWVMGGICVFVHFILRWKCKYRHRGGLISKCAHSHSQNKCLIASLYQLHRAITKTGKKQAAILSAAYRCLCLATHISHSI